MTIAIFTLFSWQKLTNSLLEGTSFIDFGIITAIMGPFDTACTTGKKIIKIKIMETFQVRIIFINLHAFDLLNLG
jgi:hypothetical protein